MSYEFADKNAGIGIPKANDSISATSHNICTCGATRTNMCPRSQQQHTGNVVEKIGKLLIEKDMLIKAAIK